MCVPGCFIFYSLMPPNKCQASDPQPRAPGQLPNKPLSTRAASFVLSAAAAARKLAKRVVYADADAYKNQEAKMHVLKRPIWRKSANSLVCHLAAEN